MLPDDPADEARRLRDLIDGHPEHLGRALPRLIENLQAAQDPRIALAAVEALGHA